MARRVFFSFHYNPDNWRAGQVRGINAISDGEHLVDNSWEEVRKDSELAITRWINSQISGTSCTIVLIGSETASRAWVEYEIRHSWEKQSQGILGIHIHRLLDRNGDAATKGANPFAAIPMNDGSRMSDWIDTYDPAGTTSKDVYSNIAANIAGWVERAIDRR